MPFLQPHQQRQSTEGINSVKALLPKLTILSYEHGKKRWAAGLFTARNLGSKGIIIAEVTSVEPVNATLLTS